MNLLFYQPYNQRVPYIESLVEAFCKSGYKVYFISDLDRGDLHNKLEEFGCETFSISIKRSGFINYYSNRLRFLINFCKEKSIDIVYSHYQEANLLSVFAQFFVRSKFVITRHHSDCGFLDYNRKEIIGDKIINSLAKVYVVPSKLVYDQVTQIEHGSSSKLKLINYAYNFELFPKPDLYKVDSIRKFYKTAFLIVKAARMIPEKRHYILLNVIRTLIIKDIDVKVLLLGAGPGFEELKNQVKEMKLDKHIFLLGFQTDIHNYYAAADLIVHTSESEASNSAIKEAAMIGKTVAVCENVGDFSDYVIHKENGFLLSKEPVQAEIDLLEILVDSINGKYSLDMMGGRLKESVQNRFDINKIFPQYLKLHQELI